MAEPPTTVGDQRHAARVWHSAARTAKRAAAASCHAKRAAAAAAAAAPTEPPRPGAPVTSLPSAARLRVLCAALRRAAATRGPRARAPPTRATLVVFQGAYREATGASMTQRAEAAAAATWAATNPYVSREALTARCSPKVASWGAWLVAATARIARTYTDAYQSAYGAVAMEGQQKMRLHALIQRNRYAAMLAHIMTGGLLRRTVNGTKAVVDIGRCRPRAGSVNLVRRMAKHVHVVYVDEHNTSQTCAECGHGLCNTYVSPDSSFDLTPLKAESTYAQRASASAAKRASPLCGGRRARRGVTAGSRSVPRDGAAAERAKEHVEALRTKVLQAIAAHGKWAFGTDQLALWGVKLCTNFVCPATYVERDTNAARNMSKIAIKSIQGRSVYFHIRGYTVPRAPPQDDPFQAAQHADVIEAGTYEACYGCMRCSPTSCERWPRPVVTDLPVAEAGTARTAVAVAAPTERVEALGVVSDGAHDAAAALASGDLATMNVGQMAASSPAPVVGHSHSSSSRLERVILDCSPGSSRGV